jgi:hypothetical protein
MKSFSLFLITSFLLTACASATSPVNTDTVSIEVTPTPASTEKPVRPTQSVPTNESLWNLQVPENIDGKIPVVTNTDADPYPEDVRSVFEE